MSRRAICAAIFAALLGCRVYDGRGEIRILPEETLRANTSVTLRVEAPPGVSEVTLFLDGKALPNAIPTGRELQVRLDASDGTHRLVARGYEGPVPTDSEARRVVVDATPPHVHWEPGEVPTPPSAPAVELVSDETLTAASLESVSVENTAHERVPFTAESTRGGAGIRVTLAEPLAGTVLVSGTAADAAGNASPFARSFSPAPWRAGFASPVPGPLHGRVTVRLTPVAEAPLEAELLVNGAVVGTLRPPDWSLEWDSDTVPEGVARLSVRASGWIPPSPISVTVDRTPPAFTCRPTFSSPDDLGRTEDVVFEANEPFSFTQGPFVTATGGATTLPVEETSPSSIATMDAVWWSGSQPVPSEVVLTFPAGAADVAGNLTPEPFTCRLGVRTWHRPFGAGAVPLPAGGLASEAVPSYDAGVRDGVPLAWVDRATGALRIDLLEPGASPARIPSEPLSTPGAVATALGGSSRLVWREQTGGGAGRIFTFAGWTSGLASGPLNANGTDADQPDSNGDDLAWIEAAGDVHAIVFGGYARSWSPIGTTGVEVAHPALPPSGNVVAWIERTSGSAWTVRARVWTLGAWRAVGTALNADPGVDAGPPRIVAGQAPLIVWPEAGTIQSMPLRSVLVVENGISEWSYEPTDVGVLYDGALGAARLLAGNGRILAWVVATPEGDRVRARDVASGVDLGWVDDGPSAASVVALSVLDDRWFAWTTEAGEVFVRYLNR